jgi:hypothetical protein
LEDDDDRTPSERAEVAARAVLSGLQDDVMYYLTEQWPVDGQGNLAFPEAQAEAGTLHLWFGGSEETAVIRLQPIALDVLQTSD